jgi:hypothetical protein
VVLRLRRAYYDKRIAELDEQIEQAEDTLRRADFDQLSQEHQQLSIQLLHTELGAHYRDLPRTTIRGENLPEGRHVPELRQGLSGAA